MITIDQRDKLMYIGIDLIAFSCVMMLASMVIVAIINAKFDIKSISYTDDNGIYRSIKAKEINISEIHSGDKIVYFDGVNGEPKECVVTNIAYNGRIEGYEVQLGGKTEFIDSSAVISRTSGFDDELDKLSTVRRILISITMTSGIVGILMLTLPSILLSIGGSRDAILKR